MGSVCDRCLGPIHPLTLKCKRCDPVVEQPDKPPPKLMRPYSYYRSRFDNGYLELWMPELADAEELEMFEYLIALVVRQQRRRIESSTTTPTGD